MVKVTILCRSTCLSKIHLADSWQRIEHGFWGQASYFSLAKNFGHAKATIQSS